MMDMRNATFGQFKEGLKETMPQLISEILSYRPEEKIYGIAFLTTDDFFGMYAAFETEEHYQSLEEKKKTDYRRWAPNEWGFSDQELPSAYNKALYENLVAVVESDESLDFTRPSDEKWLFAVSLIDAIGEAICELPPSLFEKHGYCKDDIVFVATMSDGDYMDEMLIHSAIAFNAPAVCRTILDFLNSSD